MSLTFNNIESIHYNAISKIYEQGIATGNATFQQNAPTWEVWDEFHLKSCRIIGVLNQEIVGWAALTPISSSCSYSGVAEVSVYVDEKYRGKKIGYFLLEQLIRESESNEIWMLQASIFPENEASIKIHISLGFRIVGTREKIGKMNNLWRDTVLLERRSQIVELN